jgi:branched-chain amino acid transport system ATP-binding protein
MSVLEVRHVSKRFGSLAAVRDVSLTVEKGELRAVIGPNGAGKTTFFNLISGFFPPSMGTIVFDGLDITALPAYRRVAAGIARTFQITEIFPELTVFENVRISAEVTEGFRLRPWISSTERARVRRHVEETLELTGLAGKSHRLVGELPHWRCGRACCCSTSPPPAWAIRRLTRLRNSCAACTATAISPSC